MIRPRLAPLAFTPLALLAACGDGKDGTTIAINTSGGGGNVVAGVDGKTGDMSINAPGFSGRISLPRIKLDAGNFDMNGVHLYPGSTVSAMDINAHDGKAGKLNTTILLKRQIDGVRQRERH